MKMVTPSSTSIMILLAVVIIQSAVIMHMCVDQARQATVASFRADNVESDTVRSCNPWAGLTNASIPHVRDNVTGCLLPNWVNGGPDVLAFEIDRGSDGLTDKANGKDHSYHVMYHRYMAEMVLKRYCSNCGNSASDNSKQLHEGQGIKMLEIGLGCAVGGGMIRDTPGGSARAWRYLFGSEHFLELHVLEYDADCANKWAAEHPNVAKVHTGDASSPQVLAQLVDETGPFDIIIDDGSHINWHQIITLENLISSVNPGGFYVVEDIHSSCMTWSAMIGTQSRGEVVGGTTGCMQTSYGNETIFAKVVEWQKGLIMKQEPFPGVNHIDFHKEAVLFGKITLS